MRERHNIIVGEQQEFTIGVLDTTGDFTPELRETAAHDFACNLIVMNHFQTTSLITTINDRIPEVVILHFSDKRVQQNAQLLWMLKMVSPRTNFIIIVQSPEEAFDALKMGAIGYTYRHHPTLLVRAVCEGARNRAVIDDQVANLILAYADNSNIPGNERLLLTETERYILKWLARGKEATVIEGELHLHVSVAYYMGNVAMKLADAVQSKHDKDIEERLIKLGILQPWEENDDTQAAPGKRNTTRFSKQKRTLQPLSQIACLAFFFDELGNWITEQIDSTIAYWLSRRHRAGCETGG